jgi:glycerate kinase
MNILIACDKFKGSLTAAECCEIIACAIEEIYPGQQIIQIPMADGGDGSLGLFTRSKNGTVDTIQVHDPLMNKQTAEISISEDRHQCFIEMASASGLMLIPESERNALLANSIGTGELFMHAWARSVSEIIIGVGGSASTDGGTGFAYALGYRFLDRSGKELMPSGKNLRLIRSIRPPDYLKRKVFPQVIAACDVSNPLFGPDGAAYCFARQKGALEDDLLILDEGLRQLAYVTTSFTGCDFSTKPGAGAGGGTGFGLMAFAGAEYTPGFDWISKIIGLEKLITGCDLIITGEGRIDEQTVFGKTVSGVCRLAARQGIPVVAYSGEVKNKGLIMNQLNLRSIFSLTETGTEQEVALKQAKELLSKRVRETIGEFIVAG